MTSMRETVLNVTGMTCGHCVKHVDGALRRLPGVTSVDVKLGDSGQGRAVVKHDPASAPIEALLKAVEQEGYEASPSAG